MWLFQCRFFFLSSIEHVLPTCPCIGFSLPYLLSYVLTFVLAQLVLPTRTQMCRFLWEPDKAQWHCSRSDVKEPSGHSSVCYLSTKISRQQSFTWQALCIANTECLYTKSLEKFLYMKSLKPSRGNHDASMPRWAFKGTGSSVIHWVSKHSCSHKLAKTGLKATDVKLKQDSLNHKT